MQTNILKKLGDLLMRQLVTQELATVSGGNDGALFLGLGLTALGFGMLASTPSYGYGYGSYNYGYASPVVYAPMPVTTQVVTPVYQNGYYVGDMVDTYTTYY